MGIWGVCGVYARRGGVKWKGGENGVEGWWLFMKVGGGG